MAQFDSASMSADDGWRESLRRVIGRQRQRAERDALQRRVADLKAKMRALTGEATVDIARSAAAYDELLSKVESLEKRLLEYE